MSTTPITTTTIAAKTNCGFGKLELDSYNSCKIWLEGYNSQATKKLYRIHLSLFCKYLVDFADVIYWNKSRSYQRLKDKASKKIAGE